jgi:anti-anti-sigma factor
MPQGNQALKPTERRFAVHTDHLDSGERIRVGVKGEMDLSVIGLVDREVERAEATAASQIVLDLDELDFMDAAGVGLLLQLSARSQSNGGRLRIAGEGSPQVRRVLELTGVSAVLPFED